MSFIDFKKVYEEMKTLCLCFYIQTNIQCTLHKYRHTETQVIKPSLYRS